MDWRPSDVHPSPRKLVFFGHFQPAFACPVVFLAEISFFQGSLVRQMLLLAKEMKEKVKNEIVLHPPNSDARWGSLEIFLGEGAVKEKTPCIKTRTHPSLLEKLIEIKL